MEIKQRKQMRLKNFDYSQNGYYFITICTKDMKQVLSDIYNSLSEPVASGFHARQNEVKSATPGFNVNPQIKLFEIGKVVDDTIRYMNSNYDFIRITHYVIMPNHVHLIISVNNPNTVVGRGSPTLQEYIKRLKTFTTKKYGQKLWQRGFYDHIIRNEEDLYYHIQYINENPKKWIMGKDEYYA